MDSQYLAIPDLVSKNNIAFSNNRERLLKLLADG